MKTIGYRSLVIFLALFVLIGGIVVLLINLATDGERWVAQAYNGHIYDSDSFASQGRILDTNGVLLAYTENGERYYSDNASIRKAMLHTVGDVNGYIGTSVQATQISSLSGYNFFTGLNPLPFTDDTANDITLTVDSSLSAKAYELLNGKDGVVLIYNYKTGEVLCKVSAPTFDVNNMPEDIETDPNYEGVYLDNTISSTYTPGSIFKVVSAATLIENVDDYSDITVHCDGHITIDGGEVTCLRAHGDVNLQSALGNSCNVYFAEVSSRFTGKQLEDTATEMGFNQVIEYPNFTGVASSVMTENATDLELAWASTGQFTDTANPMHVLTLMGAIANGGTAVSPIIIEGTNTSNINLVDKNTAAELQILMRNVVRDYYGDYLFEGYNMCAKTGTAEVGEGIEPHTWMTGFSLNDSTPYAFVVMVEEGDSGLGTAGTIASSLFNYMK